jgi:hypothetical protein
VGEETLLAPLNVGLVPPPLTAEVARFSVLEAPVGDSALLAAEDWELERGLNPTCFIHIAADYGGDGWRILI